MRFWCATAWMDPESLIGIAELLDEAGYHGLMVSDHLVYPRQLASSYPYSPTGDGRPHWGPDAVWPDPWVLIGAMAARTRQLCFTTNVYVAPMRPLLEVAKAVGTASVISGGRVALGAGAGWMREEFDLQGQDFDNRGKRFSEMIVALRQLWKGGWVEFHGEFYDIPALTMEPHPAEPVPIYVGGHSDAALRRAARVGDGWLGADYSWDDLAHHVGRLRKFLAEAGRGDDHSFEIIAAIRELPSVELYERAERELGVTSTLCMPWLVDRQLRTMWRDGVTAPVEAFRESIDRFAAEILADCRT